MRTLDSFRRSLAKETPPAGLGQPLEALWWDAKGDWARAHRCVQDDDTAEGARVHAYLHRKEGDETNAAYWYRRAGVEPAHGALATEWRQIAAALLAGR
jgi:hypothetical protein